MRIPPTEARFPAHIAGKALPSAIAFPSLANGKGRERAMRGIPLLSGAAACLRGGLMGMIMLVGGAPWRGVADTIAHTGFEEPGSLGDISGTVQRIAIAGAITNEPSLQNARYTAGTVGAGVEIGFSTSWRTNANSQGDGIGPVTSSGDTLDLVGVTDLAPPGTNFIQGAFGFIIEDADGEIALTFDAVDLSAHQNRMLSLDVFLSSTTWEAADYLRVSVSGSGTNLVVFDTVGLDIDDLAIEGAWNHIDASLEGFDQAVLRIAFSSNAADERLWADNIVFSGMAIPEPSVAALVGVGVSVLGLAFWRTRMQARWRGARPRTLCSSDR